MLPGFEILNRNYPSQLLETPETQIIGVNFGDSTAFHKHFDLKTVIRILYPEGGVGTCLVWFVPWSPPPP